MGADSLQWGPVGLQQPQAPCAFSSPGVLLDFHCSRFYCGPWTPSPAIGSQNSSLGFCGSGTYAWNAMFCAWIQMQEECHQSLATQDWYLRSPFYNMRFPQKGEIRADELCPNCVMTAGESPGQGLRWGRVCRERHRRLPPGPEASTLCSVLWGINRRTWSSQNASSQAKC